jgi:hypothetical protein
MKKFRDFESAREFTRALNLKGRKEWREYCKSGNKPDDIPVGVEKTYKNDFKGMADFLGTENVFKNFKKQFLPFKEAREFTRELKFKSRKEWEEYRKSANKPDNIPTNPNIIYKEWIGMGDWLGNGAVADRDKVFLPFKEAREFVRALNLNGQKEWYAYCKSANKPDNIPTNPWNIYKEWKKK